MSAVSLQPAAFGLRPAARRRNTLRRSRQRVANVEKICRALDVPLHQMLEMIDDPPKSKRKRKSKAKKKKS